jgi:hypothetical protein
MPIGEQIDQLQLFLGINEYNLRRLTRHPHIVHVANAKRVRKVEPIGLNLEIPPPSTGGVFGNSG